MGIRPAGMVAEERSAEKLVLEACAPRSPVEYTPAGKTGLAPAVGVKVLVETQNALPVASVSPLVALRVASLVLMPVAAWVVTTGPAADARVASDDAPAVPAKSASAVIADTIRKFVLLI
jgi:hypothetical protein